MTKIHTVNVQVLHDWLAKQSAVLVDVRSPEENRECRIPGSILVPVGSCNHSALPDSAGKKLVFHCKGGKRSMMACQGCIDGLPDDMDIYNLEGGIDAWTAAGYPCERG